MWRRILITNNNSVEKRRESMCVIVSMYNNRLIWKRRCMEEDMKEKEEM
jgi:hypothetical protein